MNQFFLVSLILGRHILQILGFKILKIDLHHVYKTIQIIQIIQIIQVLQCQDEDPRTPGARSSDAAANGSWCLKIGTSTVMST